jgi:hypothetical protein
MRLAIILAHYSRYGWCLFINMLDSPGLDMCFRCRGRPAAINGKVDLLFHSIGGIFDIVGRGRPAAMSSPDAGVARRR